MMINLMGCRSIHDGKATQRGSGRLVQRGISRKCQGARFQQSFQPGQIKEIFPMKGIRFCIRAMGDSATDGPAGAASLRSASLFEVPGRRS